MRVGQEPLDLFRSYMVDVRRRAGPAATSAPRWSATSRSTGTPVSAPSEPRSGTRWSAAARAAARAPARVACGRRSTRVLRAQPRRARSGCARRASARPTTSAPSTTCAAARSRQGRPARRATRSACSPCRARTLVRVHASSGTHGKPTVVGYTRADLDDWTEVMARCMTMAGVRPGMVCPQRQRLRPVHRRSRLPPGRRADRRDGASRSPAASARGRRCCSPTSAGRSSSRTPSYALVIAQAVRDAGIEPDRAAARDRAVRRRAVERADAGAARARAGAHRGEPLRPLGDVRAGRCRRVPATARAGLHVQEDHFLVEVIDPESGERLAPRGRRASSCSPP